MLCQVPSLVGHYKSGDLRFVVQCYLYNCIEGRRRHCIWCLTHALWCVQHALAEPLEQSYKLHKIVYGLPFASKEGFAAWMSRDGDFCQL